MRVKKIYKKIEFNFRQKKIRSIDKLPSVKRILANVKKNGTKQL